MADELYNMQTSEIQSALSDNVYESDTDDYLIFRSDGILYGVDANYVSEILTEVSVTRMPLVPPQISGVINLRGQIVPILDFRLLLGRMPGEDYCAIILIIDDVPIGMLVDTVDQMVAIERSAILPVPSQQTEQRMVSGMCTLPNDSGTVMVMDCTQLMHD